MYLYISLSLSRYIQGGAEKTYAWLTYQNLNTLVNIYFYHFTPSKSRMLLVRMGLQGMKMKEKTKYREDYEKDRRLTGFKEMDDCNWLCI